MVFITSNLLTAEDQMRRKVLVWLPMKSISSFFLLLVRFIFSGYEFLAVFRQVWDCRRRREKVRGGGRLG